MDDDELSDEDFDAQVRHRAARRAQAIVKREGAALAQSARGLNEESIAADSQLLAIVIAQAILDAYGGDIDGDEGGESTRQAPS
ncbi:hypothetical protein [Mesorhizobium sp. CAU 1741]|uniref:hypothetical protein n=1 Tax=Mesorhizobium sp. CAU 1741 TaxID=3140366 RepID=UPI00325B88E2